MAAARLFPFVLLAPSVLACSNVLVTPGASADGTALVGDNDDNSARLGLVSHWPAADHKPGDTREIWDFDSGLYLGSIAQPAHTLNVISRGNEAGVVMSETTHGGLRNLTGGTGIIDYGSLMVATLQRATTARDAVKIAAQLANEYGYASSMEGFSISDGVECWYMELIGKGEYGKGLLWVALRVPDGYITANANQARITTFLPCKDPNTCMMAPDTVTFAIAHGLYHGSAHNESFSFSDVYDPVTPFGARFCEARVWYIFSQLADPADFDAGYYLPYAQGFNLTRRMPLWVRPKSKVSRQDVHDMLSSKYEGSWFDPATDVGAGAEASPYRWNGLTWTYDKKEFVNERIVGTQATAWHFVASVRADRTVPPPLRALLWFGTDDHAHSPKVPHFGGAAAVARSYDDGNCTSRKACREAHGLPGSMLEFSWESAYWVSSSVARLTYMDYCRAVPMVQSARDQYEAWVGPMVAEAEATARRRFGSGDTAGGVAILSKLAVAAGDEATKRWTALWQDLMVTLQDGDTARVDKGNKLCGCHKSAAEYKAAWLGKVVADTGDRKRLPGTSCAWLDDDGHCHPRKPSTGAEDQGATGQISSMLPIPKFEVRGVVG